MKKKRLICYLMAIIIIVSAVGVCSFNSYAEEYETNDGQYIMESEYEEFDINEDSKTINDEKLITNVSNPSSGVIKFVLHMPANSKASYKIELKVSKNRKETIEIHGHSCENKTNKAVSKTISFNVNYFTDNYTVSATCSTGPVRYKTYYKDTDYAMSRLKKTEYTNKFVWDTENIRKYENGQRVHTFLSFAVTGLVDLYFSKGAMSTVVSIAFFCVELISVDDGASTKTIMTTPIKGWGYQIKCVPIDKGVKQYLVVYDSNDKLYETYELSERLYGGIIPIIK
ncbi:hypothetical protein SAMN04487934_11021 [Eubacterium ruminantium]|nr:hypothetical protein SAMN04487934_11021 [Eubacterium ruminantium]